MTTHDQITALAPMPEPFDPAWSEAGLLRILSEPAAAVRPKRPWWRRTRRRAVALAAAGVLALTAGTAVAVGGPTQVVRDTLLDFSKQPNTTGNGLGVLDEPVLVAKFATPNGVFAYWLATSSRGTVCYADADGTWDGEGVPTKSELDYGCGGMIVSPTDPDQLVELTRQEQVGGFFKDADGPLIYGISPYPGATRARVQGTGVDRTLPLRTDSLGYGAALPEAADAEEVTVTFIDDADHVLGSKRWVAPVG